MINLNMETITLLPDDLIYMISEKLKYTRDLVALSVCSKRLNFICREANYKNDIFDIDRNENKIKEVLGFNKNIKLKLNLSYSENISYVSMLGNVHTLDLSCCYNISDVSM